MRRIDIELGPVAMTIHTNIEAQPFAGYFASGQYVSPWQSPDRQILAIRAAPDLASSTEHGAFAPSSYRERQLRRGYYTTHYFGSPAFGALRGTNLVLVSVDVELLVWRLFVKLFLTVDGERRQLLHLKAAGLRCGSHTYLVAGTGGTGKTTFLHAMMAQGAQFLSNTHVLVGDDMVAEGVHSNVRFRSPPGGRVVKPRGQLAVGEASYDPVELYGRERLLRRSPVSGILLLERGPADVPQARLMPVPDALMALRHWSCALNFYDLKHDVLDLLGGDHLAFAEFASSVDARLRRLCESTPTTVLRVDVLKTAAAERIYHDLCEGAHA
jgi:hypothetical protein